MKLINENIFNINFVPNKINTIISSNKILVSSFFDLIYNKRNSKEVKCNDIFYVKEDISGMLFNINVLGDIKYYIKKINQEKLNELLKMFNLSSNICDKNYIELSNSEARKILIIIALMIDSKIIILDNPIVSLDYQSVQSLIKQLKKIKREDKTIILTSHDTNFLLEVSDKIWVINENKILNEGDKYEIFSNEKLLSDINLKVPNVLDFINKVKDIKNIKLGYRDNINDLIKDIYRYAK